MLYLDFILQYVFVSRFLFKTSCFLSFLTYFSCLFLPLVISISLRSIFIRRLQLKKVFIVYFPMVNSLPLIFISPLLVLKWTFVPRSNLTIPLIFLQFVFSFVSGSHLKPIPRFRFRTPPSLLRTDVENNCGKVHRRSQIPRVVDLSACEAVRLSTGIDPEFPSLLMPNWQTST